MGTTTYVCIKDFGIEERYSIEKNRSLWLEDATEEQVINELGLIAVESLIGGEAVELEDLTESRTFSDHEDFAIDSCDIKVEGHWWYCEQQYFDTGKVDALVLSDLEAKNRFTDEKYKEIHEQAKVGNAAFWETSISDVYVNVFGTRPEAETCAEKARNA